MKPKERSINYALLSSSTDQQCVIETDRQIIRTFSPITEPVTNTKEVEFPIDLSVKKLPTTTTKQQQQQIILPSTTIIYDHHNHHGTNFDSFKEYHHRQQQHTFVDSRYVPQSSIDVDWTTSTSSTTTKTTSGRYLMNDLLKHNHNHTSAFHQYPITGNLFPYLFIDPLGRSSQIHVKQQQQQPQPPPPPLPTTLTSSSSLSSLHSISANIDENIHHHQSNLAHLKSQSTINSTLLLDQYAMPYRLHAAAAAAAAAAKDSVPYSFPAATARFVDNHPRHIANGSNHLSNQHYHTHMMHRNARDIHNSSNRIIDHHLNHNNKRLPLSAESTSSSTSSSPYDYPDYNQADSLKNTIDDNNQQPTTTGTGSSSSPPSSLSSSISIPSPTSTTMLVKNSSSSSSSMVKTNSISNKNDDHYPTNIIKMNGSRIACYYESGDDGSTLSPLSSSFQSCQRQNYLKNFGLRKSLSDPCLSPSSSSSTTKITFILKNRTLFRSKSESFIINRLTTATTISSNDKNFLARKTRIVINKSTNCSSTTLKSTVTTASTISTITAAAATSTKICAPKKLFASNYLLDKLTDNDKHNNISCDQLNCGAQSVSNNASKITAATTTKFYRNYRKEVIECWDNEHRDDGSEIIKQKQINNRPLKSFDNVDDKDDVVATKNHKESNGFIQPNKILDLRITANHNNKHGDRLLPLMIVNHNVDDDDDEHIVDSNEQMMYSKSSSMALSSSSSPPSSSTSIKYMDADSNHDQNHNQNDHHHNYMMTMMMMKTINSNQTNNDDNDQQLDIYKQYYKYLMQCDATAAATSASPSPSSFATRAAAAAAAVAETYAKLLSNNNDNNKCIDNKHVSLSYNQKNINNINDIKTSLIDHHHHNQNRMMITSQNTNKSFENNGLYETKRNSPDCSQDNVVHQMNNNMIGKCELRSADTTNGGIIFDRKRISRPLTGKHVRHGTGASPSTLISLRNMIQQRQKLKEIGKFNCTLRYGKSKNNANKRLKHRK